MDKVRIFGKLLCNKAPQRCLRLVSTFRADETQITLTDRPQHKPEDSELQFGVQMTDHMLEVDYTVTHGWGRPHIRRVEPLQVHPAAKVFHYASELFEGMKCYRCIDGKIRMFRPMANAERLHKSSLRTSLPGFDPAELLKCIKKLVLVDQEWVPYSNQCSLYIRPVIIGTQASLGVSGSTEAKLFVIASPVGPYFPTGMKAVRVLADPKFVRAWPGGCGRYKMGSNYAPTIAVQAYATQEHNCQQVLWLFGEDQQITELGVMNFFIHWTNEDGELELVTPPLDSGLILPGVTRCSLLELAREWNEFKVSEKTITMETFIKALNEGRVKEVFGSGTASTVCPVRLVVYGDQDLVISDSEEPGELAKRFFKEINDIHMYRRPHAWMDPIDSVLDQTLVDAEFS